MYIPVSELVDGTLVREADHLDDVPSPVAVQTHGRGHHQLVHAARSQQAGVERTQGPGVRHPSGASGERSEVVDAIAHAIDGVGAVLPDLPQQHVRGLIAEDRVLSPTLLVTASRRPEHQPVIDGWNPSVSYLKAQFALKISSAL